MNNVALRFGDEADDVPHYGSALRAAVTAASKSRSCTGTRGAVAAVDRSPPVRSCAEDENSTRPSTLSLHTIFVPLPSDRRRRSA